MYTYNADGLRSSETTDGSAEYYVYDGDQLVVTIASEAELLYSGTIPASGSADLPFGLYQGRLYFVEVSGMLYAAKAELAISEFSLLTDSEDDTPEVPVDPGPVGPPAGFGTFVTLTAGSVIITSADGGTWGTVDGPVGTRVKVYAGDPRKTDASYIRGLGLIASKQDQDVTYYHYNAHGDVVQLTDVTGAVVKDYTYDAFGVEQNASDTDTNPFRYCGEQYDSETGNYYLRARYYTPGTGRFGQEDPVMDGLNWYGYCGGNPVGFVDPSGLFGSNTKLSQSQIFNPDVVALQRQLVSLGYLDMSEEGWGCFGPKTLSAVNKYKDDNGLWNFGEYKGIVGETTWRHLGLPIDNDYEAAAYNFGTPELKNQVFYATGNGPSIVLPSASQWITPGGIVKDTAKEIGITLASGEAGFYKIDGNAGLLDWEGNMLRATADAKATNERVGASALAEFAGVQGSFNIPILWTGHDFVVTLEGSLLGLGGEVGWSKEKGLGAKLVPGVGGGVFFNIK